MISSNEQQEVFTFINHEIHDKTAKLMDFVRQSDIKVDISRLSDVEDHGIAANRIYYIADGHISAEYDGKELFLYGQGDIIAHTSIEDFEETGIYYSAQSEVTIESISFDDLFNLLEQNTEMVSLWFSITALFQLQFKQIIGVLTKKQERANPGFMRYKAGMTIINEGDEAEYVYSINEGVAVAIHNGVEVGEIKKDEIFGAIAVLTDQKRTASVVAKTSCMVLMVHKDEFSQMVHSHPKLFLNILQSLADKIISLNKRVSERS